jgi:hypothetical protein
LKTVHKKHAPQAYVDGAAGSFEQDMQTGHWLGTGALPFFVPLAKVSQVLIVLDLDLHDSRP